MLTNSLKQAFGSGCVTLTFAKEALVEERALAGFGLVIIKLRIRELVFYIFLG